MSAPTTAEVRALVQTAWADAQSDGPYRDNIYAQGSHGGRAEALESIALPIAEHRDAAVAERDALAAEVAQLKAQKNIHDSEVPRHLSARQVDECDAARLRAILECGSSPYGVHRCCHCDSEVT